MEQQTKHIRDLRSVFSPVRDTTTSCFLNITLLHGDIKRWRPSFALTHQSYGAVEMASGDQLCISRFTRSIKVRHAPIKGSLLLIKPD